MGCEDLVLEFPFVPFLYPCFSNVPFQSLCYSWVFQNPTPCKSFRGLHPEIKGHFSSEAAESLFFMILPHALSKDFFSLRFKVERTFPAKSVLAHSAQWCAEPTTGKKLCCNK